MKCNHSSRSFTGIFPPWILILQILYWDLPTLNPHPPDPLLGSSHPESSSSRSFTGIFPPWILILQILYWDLPTLNPHPPDPLLGSSQPESSSSRSFYWDLPTLNPHPPDPLLGSSHPESSSSRSFTGIFPPWILILQILYWGLPTLNPHPPDPLPGVFPTLNPHPPDPLLGSSHPEASSLGSVVFCVIQPTHKHISVGEDPLRGTPPGKHKHVVLKQNGGELVMSELRDGSDRGGGGGGGGIWGQAQLEAERPCPSTTNWPWKKTQWGYNGTNLIVKICGRQSVWTKVVEQDSRPLIRSPSTALYSNTGWCRRTCTVGKTPLLSEESEKCGGERKRGEDGERKRGEDGERGGAESGKRREQEVMEFKWREEEDAGNKRGVQAVLSGSWSISQSDA